MSNLASAKILQNQLKQLNRDPVDGFVCELKNDNLYEWVVYMRGPPETYYEGGIFKLSMTFPEQYPYEPPTLKFLSKFWHPNVYPDGNKMRPVERDQRRDGCPCIHQKQVLVSVMSMLSDPNFSSPANVDASVELRKDNKAFIERCKKLAEESMTELPEDFEMPVVVPRRPVSVEAMDEAVEYYFDTQDDDDDDEDDMDEDNSDKEDDSDDDDDDDDVELTEEELRELEREVEEEMRRNGEL